MFDCSGVLKKVVDCGDHVAVIIESDGETRRFRGDFPKVAPVLEKLVGRPVEWAQHPLEADLVSTLWFGPAGHLNRMLRFWAQLERATAFSPSLVPIRKPLFFGGLVSSWRVA